MTDDMTNDPTPAAAEARATKAADKGPLVKWLRRRNLETAIGAPIDSAHYGLAAELLSRPEYQPAAPSPETGWRLVPVVATQDQLDAVTSSDQIAPFTDSIMAGVYREMIAAAPAASSPDLAALEELATRMERGTRDTPSASVEFLRSDAAALLRLLKAQPNAGPADGGKEGK